MEIFKRFCFIFFLSFCFTTIRAQNIDTLMSQGKMFLIEKNYDSARSYYLQAMPLAEADKNNGKLAIIHNNLGVTYKTDHALKIMHFNKAIFYHTENGRMVAAAEVGYNLGIVLKKKGIYEEAIPQFLSSLTVFSDSSELLSEAKTLDVIGNLYRAMKDYENSEAYHLKALDQFTELKDEKGIGSVLHNMGQLYIANDNLELARRYLTRSRNLKEKLDQSTISNDVLMGELFVKEKKWDTAYYYYDKALQDRIILGHTQDLASSYYHLGDYHLQIKDYQQSSDYFKKANSWADSLGQNQLLIDILQKQVQVEKAQREFESLAITQEKLAKLKDEVMSEKTGVLAAHFSVKFNLIEKEREIEKQKNNVLLRTIENENLNFKYNLALIIIVVFLVLLLTILYLTIRLRRKNQLLNTQNQIIENLHSELRHRTKNYYQMLKGIFWYDLDNESDEKIRDLLKRYISRIEAMAQIQHYLVPENSDSAKGVQLDVYLSDLIDQIDVALNRSEPRVIIGKKLDSLILNYTHVSYIGITLNELLQNAFKHGFAGIVEPKIQIELVEKNDQIHLIIRDNGVGMNEVKQFKNQSNGIKLISVLANRIKGTLIFDSKKGKGVKVELIIKNKEGDLSKPPSK